MTRVVLMYQTGSMRRAVLEWAVEAYEIGACILVLLKLGLGDLDLEYLVRKQTVDAPWWMLCIGSDIIVPLCWYFFIFLFQLQLSTYNVCAPKLLALLPELAPSPKSRFAPLPT